MDDSQYEMFDNVTLISSTTITKKCRMCKADKPIQSFNIDRTSAKGKPFYRTACKACESKKSYDTELIKKVSPAPPLDRLCMCCDKYIRVEDRINFDHCPDTLTFRGWLCTNCNTGIGKLGDTIHGLNKALDYLKGDGKWIA